MVPTGGNADSSVPALQWVYTTGEYGFGRDVCQTTDGGYVIVGSTGWNPDVYLVKTDANGNETWSKTFAGSGSEYGSSVCQTTDGGYIIAGEIGTSYEPVPAVPAEGAPRFSFSCNLPFQWGESDNADIWLIKTDSDGNEIWSRRLRGTYNEEIRSALQTKDGGYVLVGAVYSGNSDHDVLLVKTNADGKLMWSQTFGGDSLDLGTDVDETTDGGYIITGRTDSFGAARRNVWLIKTDALGEETWNAVFGGDGWEYGEAVSQTADGGYVITGYTTSYGAGEEDVWLIKTDVDGNMMWSQTFGGSEDDHGKSMRQTASGGYIVAGYTESFARSLDDVWLIKTDADGNMMWNQTFDDEDGHGNEYSGAVIQTADWGYVVVGQVESRMMLLKYQADPAEVGIPFS